MFGSAVASMAKDRRLADPLDVDNHHTLAPRRKYLLVAMDLWSAVADDLELTATREGREQGNKKSTVDRPGHVQTQCRQRVEDEKMGICRTIAF